MMPIYLLKEIQFDEHFLSLQFLYRCVRSLIVSLNLPQKSGLPV